MSLLRRLHEAVFGGRLLHRFRSREPEPELWGALRRSASREVDYVLAALADEYGFARAEIGRFRPGDKLSEIHAPFVIWGLVDSLELECLEAQIEKDTGAEVRDLFDGDASLEELIQRVAETGTLPVIA